MKFKYMLVGFIAGAFAATALTAGASSIYEKYTATARPDYAIVVDGEKVTLNTPPKTIDGVTHLPIRETATILGMDVNFNSSTITLTTKESEGDNVTIAITVAGRDLIELLGVKYPELAQAKSISLSQEGLLKLGSDNYLLNITDDKKFDVTILIEAEVVKAEDF